MKKNILTLIALMGAMTWTGCQVAEEDAGSDQADVCKLELVVKAQKVDSSSKALEIGEGTEATTTSLKSVWEADEQVLVYLDDEFIGTLTATPDAENARRATLSGVVTTSGITPGSTRLTMFTPREEWSYDDQEGVLLDSDNSIEKKYNYTLASSVLVTDVSDGRITTEEAGFINQQSIYRLSFRYQANASTKTPITAGWVTISGASGELVRSLVPGGATVKGPLSVRLGTPAADPFFVAIRNDDESNEEALTFTVVDGDGITYRGSKTIPAENKVNGSFVSVKNATLPLRMELTETTTVVDAAL